MTSTSIVGILIAVYALLLVTGILREHIAAKHTLKSDPLTWEQNVRLLRAVRTGEVRRIAARSDHAAGKDWQSGGSNLLTALGGTEGLDRLLHNALVLADLARCTQDFILVEDHETVGQIEDYVFRLRCEAVLLRFLRLLRCSSHINRWVICDMAIIYCQIVTLLITLYGVTHISRRERLIAACNW